MGKWSTGPVLRATSPRRQGVCSSRLR
eukprot:gene9647-biopygen2842